MPIFFSILVQLLVGIGIQVLGYLLMPKPKADKAAVTDLESPTAEAGRPIPVVFGEVEIVGVNIIWFGEKKTHTYEL